MKRERKVKMEYQNKYIQWLNNPALCAEGKEELANIQTNEKEIEYRFGKVAPRNSSFV